MTENEKFGIEIEAKVEKFKNAMKNLVSFVKGTGKEVEEEATFKPNFSKQIEKAQADLDILTKKEKELLSLNKIYEQSKTNGGAIKVSKEEYEYMQKLGLSMEDIGNKKTFLKLEEDIEKTKNKVGSLIQKQKEYNEEQEETEDEGSRLGTTLSKAFQNSIRSLKRFTFYLLGARSVFSLFRKYQGIYFAYNEQMQYQTELSQNAIALSLAPAFEFLGNVITYVSIAFARFIELLTGVNVLSKVSTKGIRDYNKSLKETQTLVSGVDEITNLTNPGNLGLASQYDALAKFQEKVAEVQKWFEENKFLQDLAKWLREKVWPEIEKIGSYIIENWDKLKWLFAGAALTTMAFKLSFSLMGAAETLGTLGTLGKAAGMTSLGSGLGGIAGVLLTLSKIGAITIGLYVLYELTKGTIDSIKEYDKLKKQQAENKSAYSNVDIKWAIQLYETLKKVEETNGKNSDEYKNIVKGLEESINKVNEDLKNGFEPIKEDYDKILEIQEKLKEITDQDYSVNIKVNTIEGVHRSSSGGIHGGGSNFEVYVPGMYGTKRGFAKGLDYVPYDNFVATLHKGEAVVPAKYNPEIHSAGNDYTNSLLETMITKLDDVASRPNVFEVDGTQFAKATYPLYTSENKRQNYNNKVVVR